MVNCVFHKVCFHELEFHVVSWFIVFPQNLFPRIGISCRFLVYCVSTKSVSSHWNFITFSGLLRFHKVCFHAFKFYNIFGLLTPLVICLFWLHDFWLHDFITLGHVIMMTSSLFCSCQYKWVIGNS